MVVNIAIKGGLGNQLFQYALGSYLKQKYECRIKYDILPLNADEKNLTKRSFLLDRLFSDLEFTKPTTHHLFYTTYNSLAVKLYKKIYRFVNRYQHLPDIAIADLHLKAGHTYYLEGYWQSAYSAAFSVQSINACTASVLKDNPYFDLIQKSGESVALHIRRGDYVNNAFINDHHGHCDLAYYLRAMALIESKVKVDAYFIFSDDLDWARTHISSDRMLTFVEGDTQEPITDLFLMKSCRHQIISNSTFSCWASYLNTNPARQVVGPVNWTKKEKTNTLPLFEDTWMLT